MGEMVRRRAIDTRKALAILAIACLVPLLALGQCVAYAPSREAAALSGGGARVISPRAESGGLDDDESTILLSGFSDPQHAADPGPTLRTVLARPIQGGVPDMDSEPTLHVSASMTNEPGAESMPWNVLPGAATPSSDDLRPAPIPW